MARTRTSTNCLIQSSRLSASSAPYWHSRLALRCELFIVAHDDTQTHDPCWRMVMILWLAQGFGVGRIPFAPGTFGSAVGLLWLLVLLAPGNFWLCLAGVVFGIFLSVWL